jgi:hypothetical protein
VAQSATIADELRQLPPFPGACREEKRKGWWRRLTSQ